MRPAWARCALLAALVVGAAAKNARAEDRFAGYLALTGPTGRDPRALEYQALLDGYRERRCELIMGPTNIGEPVRAVFLARGRNAGIEVVSRTASPSRGADLRGLRKMTTRTAALDDESVEIFSKACADVLGRHAPRATSGKDGRSFWASHWTPRGALTGWCWSPEKGTVAHAFVSFEWRLAQFADAEPSQRPALLQGLVSAARDLSLRVSLEN
jgi:hypothetical protein